MSGTSATSHNVGGVSPIDGFCAVGPQGLQAPQLLNLSAWAPEDAPRQQTLRLRGPDPGGLPADLGY